MIFNSDGLFTLVLLHKNKRIFKVFSSELTLTIFISPMVISSNTWTLAEILHLDLIFEIVHLGP